MAKISNSSILNSIKYERGGREMKKMPFFSNVFCTVTLFSFPRDNIKRKKKLTLNFQLNDPTKGSDPHELPKLCNIKPVKLHCGM